MALRRGPAHPPAQDKVPHVSREFGRGSYAGRLDSDRDRLVLGQTGDLPLGRKEERIAGLASLVQPELACSKPSPVTEDALDPDRKDGQRAIAVDVEAEEVLPVLDSLAGERLVGVPVEIVAEQAALVTEDPVAQTEIEAENARARNAGHRRGEGRDENAVVAPAGLREKPG